MTLPAQITTKTLSILQTAGPVSQHLEGLVQQLPTLLAPQERIVYVDCTLATEFMRLRVLPLYAATALFVLSSIFDHTHLWLSIPGAALFGYVAFKVNRNPDSFVHLWVITNENVYEISDGATKKHPLATMHVLSTQVRKSGALGSNIIVLRPKKASRNGDSMMCLRTPERTYEALVAAVKAAGGRVGLS